jgi:hypothetical protein
MSSNRYDDRQQAQPTSPVYPGGLRFQSGPTENVGQYSNNLVATPVPTNNNPYQSRNSGAPLDSEKVLLIEIGSQVYKVGLDVYAPTHSESPEYDPKDPKIIELNNRKRQEKVETSCRLSPPAPPLSLSLSLSLAAHSTTPQRPGGANSAQTQAQTLTTSDSAGTNLQVTALGLV